MDFGAAAGSGVVDERQIRELAAYRTSDAFSELERQVLEYADRLTATPATVPDELHEALRSQLGEPALVDLTAEIAVENFRARFNRGFDVSSQGYAAGHACPLPARLGTP
ncbi:MAG TPA: hypothetical protein VF157_04630 [Chloroflexota bacterium]